MKQERIVFDRTGTPIAPPMAELGSDAHPLIPVPFTVSLDDRKLEGRGMSLTGCVASGLVNPEIDGEKRLAIVTFSFDGFFVSVAAEVIVEIADDDVPGRVELYFADPAGTHLPQIRHVLNAFIAGDVVALGPLLSTPEPKRAGGKDADAEPTLADKVKRGARMALLTVVSAALVAFVWMTVESRVLVRPELRPAIVRQAGEAMRAPAAGQIEFINPGASEGDVVFSVLSNSGALLNIMMPCECEVTDIAVREGATILAGEPVLTLVEPGAPLTVEAVMSYEGIHAALSGARVELIFADGQIVPAQVDPAAADEIMAIRSGDWTPVTLIPGAELSPDDMGDFVRVQVRQGFRLFGGA